MTPRPKSENLRRTKSFPVRLSPDEWAVLEAEAERRRVSVAALMRDAALAECKPAGECDAPTGGRPAHKITGEHPNPGQYD